MCCFDICSDYEIVSLSLLLSHGHASTWTLICLSVTIKPTSASRRHGLFFNAPPDVGALS